LFLDGYGKTEKRRNTMRMRIKTMTTTMIIDSDVTVLKQYTVMALIMMMTQFCCKLVSSDYEESEVEKGEP